MQVGETVFLNPQPIPPKEAVDYLVSLVAQREVLFESAEANMELIEQFDSAISRFVDEYCGTRPPRPFPPFPFLQLDSTALVTELIVRAHTLAEGGLRNSLEDVARSIVTPNSSENRRTEHLTCEQLADRIREQEGEIQSLQEELGSAPPSHKGAIVGMIRRATRVLNALVRRAHQQGCPVP